MTPACRRFSLKNDGIFEQRCKSTEAPQHPERQSKYVVPAVFSSRATYGSTSGTRAGETFAPGQPSAREALGQGGHEEVEQAVAPEQAQRRGSCPVAEQRLRLHQQPRARQLQHLARLPHHRLPRLLLYRQPCTHPHHAPCQPLGPFCSYPFSCTQSQLPRDHLLQAWGGKASPIAHYFPLGGHTVYTPG